MWPRTSWSLSSLTLNIVFGRASVTSPSISIFSSFAIGAEVSERVLIRHLGSATLERRLARTLLEEAAHGALEVLGLEQPPGRLRGDSVGLFDATLEIAAHDPLGRGVGARRP